MALSPQGISVDLLDDEVSGWWEVCGGGARG